MKKKLSAPKNTVETGIWIEQFTTLSGVSDVSSSVVFSPIQQVDTDAARTAAIARYQAATRAAAQQQTTAVVTTDQTNSITLVCRAVDQTKVSGDASANSETAFEIESQSKASSLFDSKATQLTGQIVPDDSTGTFTFGITLMPSNPLHL
jgi:hypothetical protein